MCGVKQILDYSVPVPVVAPPLVEDGSLLPKRHLDLAIGDVQSEQGNGSRPWNVEDEPFPRCGLDIQGEVRPCAREDHNHAVKMADKSRK